MRIPVKELFHAHLGLSVRITFHSVHLYDERESGVQQYEIVEIGIACYPEHGLDEVAPQGHQPISNFQFVGFYPILTDTYKKADRGDRSVHVEAKEVQCGVQARCC